MPRWRPEGSADLVHPGPAILERKGGVQGGREKERERRRERGREGGGREGVETRGRVKIERGFHL